MLNLRLGVWLANPRLVGGLGEADGEPHTYKPLVRPTYLLRELIGKNNLRGKFLYISDGGHYENMTELAATWKAIPQAASARAAA